MTSKFTPFQIASMLGVTEQQVRDGFARCAIEIRAYSAADLKRWGKTRSEANDIADDYARRSAQPQGTK